MINQKPRNKSEVILVKKEELLRAILAEKLAEVVKPGERIAIKLHFGEPGNTTAPSPQFVKHVIDIIKTTGARPFLFDSPVMYASRRDTPEGYLAVAKERGFTEQSVGCPVVISDDTVQVKGSAMTYGVCKSLADADGVLVLTHVKGHFCSGFGAAIKNLGMGALSKATKTAIHEGGKPVYLKDCQMCGACEKSCPLDNIRYEGGRPYFDKNWCCGRSDCVYACQFSALKTVNGKGFDFLLADGANAALSRFKKAYFINEIRRVTRDCDCMGSKQAPVAPDEGILISTDIVAIDKASMDLINKTAGHDFFQKLLKKSPRIHISHAEQLGMGSMDYILKTEL